MKLACFRLCPQRHPNDAFFMNTLYILDYTGRQPAGTMPN